MKFICRCRGCNWLILQRAPATQLQIRSKETEYRGAKKLAYNGRYKLALAVNAIIQFPGAITLCLNNPSLFGGGPIYSSRYNAACVA